MKYLKEYFMFIIESMVLNADSFKQICKQKYGKLYNYSNIVWQGLDKPVRIICTTHGTPFNVTPRLHLKGEGCPECKALDLPSKVSNQQGYDSITSPLHTHKRNHYVKKPRTVPYTGRKL